MTSAGDRAEQRAQPPTWRDPAIVRALAWGAAVTAAPALAIYLGSAGLASFDAALVAYTFATLFAAFGTAYRYAVWLQRPPTAMVWRRGWQAFLRPSELPRNLVVCQIWLLSATMTAFLGGDERVILPAALASLLCLGLVGGLLVVARGLGRG